MSETLSQACAAADDFLVELAYDERSGVPEDVLQHVDSCDRCRSELAALEGTRAMAGALPLEEPSAEMDARVLAELDAVLAPASPTPLPVRRARKWPQLMAAASVALVAGGTLVVLQRGENEAAYAPASALAEQEILAKVEEMDEAPPPPPAPLPVVEAEAVRRDEVRQAPSAIQRGMAAKPQKKLGAPAVREEGAAGSTHEKARDVAKELALGGGGDGVADSVAEPRAMAKMQAAGASAERIAPRPMAAAPMPAEDQAQALLARAQSAWRAGRAGLAEALFARVIESPGSLDEAALAAAYEGRIDALNALGRSDEAERLTRELAARLPAQRDVIDRVRGSNSMPAATSTSDR